MYMLLQHQLSLTDGAICHPNYTSDGISYCSTYCIAHIFDKGNY